MSAHRPVPDGVKDAIWTELQAGGSRSGIAKRFGVSHHAVRQVALAHGMTVEVQNDRLRQANEAHVLHARARRGVLAEQLLEDAARLRGQLFGKATIHQFDAKSGEWQSLELAEPEFKAKQAIAIALGISIDKALALDKYDAEGANAGRAAIVQLVEDLRAEAAS